MFICSIHFLGMNFDLSIYFAKPGIELYCRGSKLIMMGKPGCRPWPDEFWNDYHVNQKSEHELRILHAKLDNLAQNQLPHSLEIQKLEIEILGQIRTELDMIQRNQLGNPKSNLNENDQQDNENSSENHD